MYVIRGLRLSFMESLVWSGPMQDLEREGIRAELRLVLIHRENAVFKKCLIDVWELSGLLRN